MENNKESSMSPDKIRLEAQWKGQLLNEFNKNYMVNLRKFLKSQIDNGKTLYPSGPEIFNAFKYTPFNKVKVVILGQDPYHGPRQAHGLCFSVQKGIKTPPSLANIFKEIQTDLGIEISDHGDLTSWAKQGVLLLNTVLTVEKGKAGAHQGRGWESFTDQVIRTLDNREDPIVFVLWGSSAQKKELLIKNPIHKILKSPHPSPLSAHRGFFGSGHFSKINKALKAWGKEEINWKLPN
jgi:uracil-DNA glycosylase